MMAASQAREAGARRSSAGARTLGVAVVSILAVTGCDENRTVPTHEPYVGPSVEPLPCLPNLDGKIDATEVLAAYGETIRFLVTPFGVQRPVDVAGVVDSEGHRVWDLGIDYADDQVVEVVPRHPAEQWYSASFPTGTLVVPYDAAGTLDTISRQDDEALWVLGLASREPDPPEGRTLLVYATPVAALRFPIQPGVTFTSTGEVSGGLVYGLQYAGRDIYEVSVDATGEVILPQLTFTQAHRVRTKVTSEPAVGSSTSRRQVSYYFECFAEVARVTSLADEPLEDFTTATEIWRLGFE